MQLSVEKLPVVYRKARLQINVYENKSNVQLQWTTAWEVILSNNMYETVVEYVYIGQLITLRRDTKP